MVRFSTINKTVTTTPKILFGCPVKELQSVMIKFSGTIYIGDQTVTSTTGAPYVSGTAMSVNHLDFRKDDKAVQESLFEIWGVSAGSETCHVTSIRR